MQAKRIDHIKKYKEIIIFLCMMLFVIFVFMHDIFDYGIFFDEVNRYNPIFPIFNKNAGANEQAIWSIQILGRSIPMMYKEYISSMKTFWILPVLLFKNPMIGLRLWYIICFIIELIMLFAFLYRYNAKFALLVSLFTMVNPILFPDFNYGFAYLTHFIFLIGGLFFLRKYLLKDQDRYIFLSCFVLCLGANISFYFIWTLAALVVASLILDYKIWYKIVSKIKSLICAILGIVLGLFQFILYNLLNGFPTVKVFLNNLFHNKDFNMDYVHNDSYWDSLKITLSCWNGLLNGMLYVYVAVIVVMLIIWIILFIKRKQYNLENYHFYAILIFSFSLIFIMISPKPRFAYHILHLSPWFEISLILSIIYITKNRKIRYFILGLIFILNFTNSIIKVEERKISTAVMSQNLSKDTNKLTDFFLENNISSNEIWFVEWGLEAPVYFLTKGEIYDQEKSYFTLIDMDVDSIKEYMYNKILSSESDGLYIPLYSFGNGLGYENIRMAFFEVIKEYKIPCKEIVYSESANDVELYYLDTTDLYKEEDLEINVNDVIETTDYNYAIDSSKENNASKVLSGWLYLNKTQIESVLICNENYSVIGRCYYGIERPDVYNTFGAGYNSGFIMRLEQCDMYKVIVIGEDGIIYELLDFK